jgi:hypothetical protein
VRKKHGDKQTGSKTGTADKGRAGIAAASLKAGYSLVNQVDRTPYADLRVSLQKV